MRLMRDREWSQGPQGLSEEYHGPHAAVRRRGCELVEWRRVDARPVKARVVSHSCECLATVYELCGLGGVYFIRRTTRGPSRPEVHESPRMVASEAGALWFALRRGWAR